MQVIGREVIRNGLDGVLDRRALRIIGRWLKQELLPLGMVQIGSGGRVTPDHCWKTGATYDCRTI
ncbi:hypothetical protein H8A97_36430 [Bradyrhizobium sp. Arg62]|uniref:hypothetical protein n=1 Tax=Bradyrhizobium brasilense TaxID=1419277 RepID=UPI001E2F31CB|nr:hypothetical protein [Bradyrhizobium brasilense]MCC8950415.1 hypothetical protein [Bradyrhizobium brasilense]